MPVHLAAMKGIRILAPNEADVGNYSPPRTKTLLLQGIANG